MILGVNAREDTLAALREPNGTSTGPAWQRYGLVALRLCCRAIWASSYTYDVPVAGLIAERLGGQLAARTAGHACSRRP